MSCLHVIGFLFIHGKCFTTSDYVVFWVLVKMIGVGLE